jgi:TolB-like protein
MEVLVCLAEHTGEVVPKEKLLQAVWPDTFVSDDVLKRSVSELRHVFGDDAHESRVIETIPKRGYRLMVDVKPANGKDPAHLATAAAPATEAELPQVQPVTRKWRSGLLTIGIVVLVGGLLLAFNVAGIRERLVGRSGPPIRSLAVLPLQNLSGDPSQEYLADGMTEELITELSRLSSLRVISRTSVMRYKNSNKPLAEIARELGVEGIIEGSVLRSGERVRITAQLIYAPQDKNIWAQSYEQDMQDVLSLQSRVAGTIADAIRLQMTPGEQAQIKSFRPVSLKAHEAYLRGLYHLQQAQEGEFKKDKGKLGEVETEQAVYFFQQAIQADPNYAPPYVGMWEAWEVSPLAPKDWAPRARAMVLRALQLDDNLSNAHRAMAAILGTDFDWKGAEREYQRAIQLEPSNVDAHQEYSSLLFDLGRVQEGMRETELLQGLDPRNERLADAFYLTRQFDRAITLYHSRAQMNPTDFSPHWILSNIYAITGRHGEAISEMQAMDAVLDYRELAAALGRAYNSAGYERALKMYAARLQEYSRKSYIPEWYIASIYGFIGDKDQAFVWLEKAYRAKNVFGVASPMWDPLRSDPRFADLVRRLGLPAETLEKLAQQQVGS